MACFYPQRAYQGRKNANGKRQVTFVKKDAISNIILPCGKCTGCRLEKSRQWAMRCMHEASLHDENCFLTLTYSEENLPIDGSLNLKHFQDFIKRLRKQLEPRKIRFYHCGEYGEKFSRPHYHSIIFNYDFPDKKIWKQEKDYTLWTSDQLDTIWQHGFGSIGRVTFDSAAYVARYIMKKITGKRAQDHYNVISRYGEIVDLAPEYTTMSRGRRPDGGIGYRYYEKFKSEIFPDDFVIINGKKVKPPKYYERFFEKENPEAFKKHKQRLKKIAAKNKKDNTYERLLVKEKCTKARLNIHNRAYEGN